MDPGAKRAWNNKGVALERLGKFADALQAYENALRIDPDYKVPWVGKGGVLGKQGQYREELNCYEAALKIDPGFTEALLGKATALDDLGRYEEALSCYDKLLPEARSNLLIWFNRGNTLDHLGRFDDAIEAYRKVVEINPNYEAAWGNMANSLRELKRYDEALDCYERALLGNPSSPRLYLGKGFVLYLMERYEEALLYSRLAETLGSPEAANAIALCLEKIDTRSEEKTAGCVMCGKKTSSAKSLYHILLNGFVCFDCASTLLPPEAQESLKRLEPNTAINESGSINSLPIMSPSLNQIPKLLRSIIPQTIGDGVHRVKLSEIDKSHEDREQLEAFARKKQIAVDEDGYSTALCYTAPMDYFAYINDPATIKANEDLIEFLRYHAIIVPLGDLTNLWMNCGLVHTSLTALSHDADKLFVRWSKNLRGGVVEFATHAREFTQGILYPNVARTGLRDFEHIKNVAASVDVSHSLGWAKLSGEFNKPPLSINEGFEEFTKSIAEGIILAVHASIVHKVPRQLIAPTIREAMCTILGEYDCDYQKFDTAWGWLNGDDIVKDIEDAINADILAMRSFVGLAERFVLTLEGWI
jgi:FOG: TPR repeat